MNRKITDLLDAVTAEDTGPTTKTPLNASRIHARTRRAIDSGASRRRRFPAALTAAAVAAALCVTAFAADALGAGSLMRSVFGTHGDTLSQGQLEALDGTGTVFEEGITVNGATIRPVAALADECSYYLRLHISAPEGVVIPDVTEPSYLQLLCNLDLSAYQSGNTDISSNSFCLPDSDPTDGEKDVVIQYFAREGWTDVVFNDGRPKILTVEGARIITPDGSPNPPIQNLFAGHFEFDVGSNFTNSKTYALDPSGVVFQPDNGKMPGTLKTLKLSPLGIYYSMQFRYDEGGDFVRKTPRIRILDKDGVVLWEDIPFTDEDDRSRSAFLHGLLYTDHIWLGGVADTGYPDREIPGVSSYTLSGRSMFSTPLDLSRAAVVEFDGQTIPITK